MILSPNTVIFWGTGELGLQHEFWEGHNSAHNIKPYALEIFVKNVLVKNVKNPVLHPRSTDSEFACC